MGAGSRHASILTTAGHPSRCPQRCPSSANRVVRVVDSNTRTQHLISEILERLRELSYEAQRQSKTITELQAQVAALEGKGTEGGPSESEQGTVDSR